MPSALQRPIEMPPWCRSGETRRIDGAFEEELLGAGFTVANLARGRGLSVRQFERRFHGEFGVRPCVLVQETRMRLASQWLIFKEVSLKQIAADLGYSQAADFSRAFLRYFGTSPAQMRIELKKKSGRSLWMSRFANRMSRNAK